MARKTNKAQVLELAAQLGVEVEYGPMGDDGFEVALYDYAGHMARSTPWARVTPPSPTSLERVSAPKRVSGEQRFATYANLFRAPPIVTAAGLIAMWPRYLSIVP